MSTSSNVSTIDRPSLHEPWCNDHVDGVGESWCSHEVRIGEVIVEVDQQEGQDGPRLCLWGANDEAISAQQARQVAAELIKAAEVLEASA